MIIFFTVIQITGHAQSTKPSSNVEKILIQTMYDFSNAWGKSDTATLAKLLSPEYRHTDVFGKIQNKKEWLAFAASKRAVTDLNISDIDILMYPAGIAAVTGNMHYLFGPDKIKQALRFTQLLRNDNGQWKRIIFQATLIKE